MRRSLRSVAWAWTLVAACHRDRSDQPGALTAEVRIGGGGGAEALQLTYVSQMVAGTNLLFVTQRGDDEILVFDFDGRHVRTIGRNGAGPGEFSGLASIGLIGDTLWAIDTNLRRISLFKAKDGGLITTMRYQADVSLSASPENFYFPYPERLLDDGTMLGVGGTVSRRIADGQVTREPTLRMTRSGRTLDTLAWAPLTHRALIIRNGQAVRYAQQPFSDGSLVAYGAAARRIFVIDRTAATSTSHAAYTVTAIRTNGDTLWSRQYEYVPHRLDARTADSVRDRAHRAHGGRFTTDEIDKALFIPEFLAPITDAVAGEDGTLWLRREDPRATHGPAVYDVIGADGRPLGQVTAARNVHLRWMSGTTAWGDEPDADDVPVLVRYRVDMPSPSRPD